MPKKKVDAITGRRKTSRKPTVKEELFGFNTKTGKANTAKESFLKSLSSRSLRKKGKKSGLEKGIRKLIEREKKAKKK